jgi:hypothetical protein
MNSSTNSQRRVPEEKGPFGRARKRGTSRSKTATPARKEDQAKIDSLRVIDDIFFRHKVQEDNTRESLRVRKSSGPSATLPISASAPNLLDASGGLGLGASFQTGGAKEPTEVLIYGYGNEVQWAAIDYYEKVSMGLIYEEYTREPSNSKYSLAFTPARTSSYRSLSKSSLRKVNEFVGGEHWIKVTFDSPEAAERACHYSPHVIQGFTVFAERYRGTGPSSDRPLRASAGATVSQTASPNTVSSITMPFGTSSVTASSATATATGSRATTLVPRLASEPVLRGAFPLDPLPSSQSALQSLSSRTTSREPGPRTLRIRGAKAGVLRPPEQAFLPAAPRWQQTFGSWPIIGWVIGSGHGIIGDQVPRKEDGSFDGGSASLYWRVWYSVDCCFGTDFCGVRGDEYED